MIASMITSLTADMLARSRNQRIHGGGVELFVSCDQLLQVDGAPGYQAASLILLVERIAKRSPLDR